MSDYPEHDKLSLVKDQTQAIGEFLEWLSSQGVRLMTWREDLTDNRPVDPECELARDRNGEKNTCDPTDEDGASGNCARYYWISHCSYFGPPDRHPHRRRKGLAMTCPTCGCDPEDPWYDPCGNEDCPCGQAAAEEDED